jgi:hypothetical protein
LPGHWAPNDLLIYSGNAFPAAYRGGAFVAFHGSWNRAPEPQGGYNVVFQPLADGKAAGPYVVFADGFAGAVKQPGQALRELKLLWGRFKQPALGDTGALTSRCDEMGSPLHWALVERIYSNAVKDYHLHRLDSRGVLFRADPLEERPARALDETLGWKDLFGERRSSHYDGAPHSQTLARKMSTVLNRFAA